MSVIPEFAEDVFGIDRITILAQIEPIVNIFRDDLIYYLEYPYVDRAYRDTYYQFYSKKHNSYNRNSIRISLFQDTLNHKEFFKDIDIDLLEEIFFGFFTLRPTTYRIIGHSFISPKALKNNNFVCCLSSKVVSVSGLKLKIYGFPFISQDNESITCSEATIINLMDYFGSKYAEYSTILPSQVNKILSNQSYQRQLPSNGLSTESISFVLKKLGFGSVVYSTDDKHKEPEIFDLDIFRSLLYTYIESGIPVIATLASKSNNHAVIVFGRENINKPVIYKGLSKFFNQNKIVEFSNAFGKVLIMNDNDFPYEEVNYNAPLYDVDSNSDYHFKSFIVPLYSKVHIDGYQFKQIFFHLIEEFGKMEQTKHIEFLQKKTPYIYRFFLASSSSYKDYISKSQYISDDFKYLTIYKTMPKFIWIGELIKGDTISELQTVESIIVVDATESGLYKYLIFATNSKYLIAPGSYEKHDLDTITKQNRQYSVFKLDNDKFYTFATNLKGAHTQWKS